MNSELPIGLSYGGDCKILHDIVQKFTILPLTNSPKI